MKKLGIIIALMKTFSTTAQDTTQKASPFSFSGYAEVYYGYDFNKPSDNNRPPFVYSHNRHNEFNANLAYVKAAYNTDKTRANIAIAAGTYMNANYAAEPGVLKNIYEANAGFKLSKKGNLWIDAGILPSHIGFESARSSDCWTLTRSLIADNSPYFEGGAKLTYTTDNNKWLLSALALNGWQRIQRVAGNSLMSWGTQIQFKPGDKTMLNYSTFIGTDKPDSARRWRYFHNVYGIFQLAQKLGLTLGFDLGQEEKSKGSTALNTWYGTAAILRYAPSAAWAFALRGEYYSDAHGVIVPTVAANGFKTAGLSFNADKIINANFMWRTEIKTWQSADAIFAKGSGFVKSNTVLTTSLALSF